MHLSGSSDEKFWCDDHQHTNTARRNQLYNHRKHLHPSSIEWISLPEIASCLRHPITGSKQIPRGLTRSAWWKIREFDLDNSDTIVNQVHYPTSVNLMIAENKFDDRDWICWSWWWVTISTDACVGWVYTAVMNGYRTDMLSLHIITVSNIRQIVD